MALGRKFRRLLVVATVAATAAVIAVTASAQPEGPEGPETAGPGGKPTIRYTEYGVPHIIASDYEGLGEGYAYAVAKDNICVLADIYLSMRAQRSRFLGPDGVANVGYTKTTSNLESDLFFQRMKDDRVIEEQLEQKPPNGPDPEVRDGVRGYVKGYNRYLEETGVDNIKDPACRGKDWVRPITEMDVYRHAHHAVLIGSTDYVLEGEVNAKPAVGISPDSPKAQPPKDLAKRIAASMNARHDQGIGSNGLAVGADGVSEGKSMLLANPHFLWQGKNRWYQAHLTIPGKADAAGASILGLPGVMFGHNNDVAWTHTVSTVSPIGLFDVQVDPLHPTKYLVDGKWEDMKSQQVTVEVRREDGSIEKVARTLWRTRYGPVTTSLDASSIPLPWVVSAHVVRDANTNNLRALNTWTRMPRVKNTSDVVDVLEKTQGVPFLNTIAADRDGKAMYADIQAVPNISDEHAEKCLTETGKLLFYGDLVQFPVSIFDGKRSECDWPDDPEAVGPGLLSPKKMPRLTRTDYVGNANDSPWLANPEQPLTYPRVMGNTGKVRSLRTQQLIRTAQKRLDGSDGLPGKGFSSESMKQLLYADQSRAAEVAREDAVKMCKGFAGGLAPYDGGLVNVAEACPILEKWDGTYSLDSRGSLLFQAFWDNTGGKPWEDAFDAKDPVNTPNQLATGSVSVWKAFGNAVVQLRRAGIPLDAPLGEHQAVTRNDKRIPIHGSRSSLGLLNVMEPVWDTEKGGNTDVRWGSSYIGVIRFPDEGPPETSTVMTYSQSTDPTSPHYADQTELYSKGEWVTERFTEKEIADSPELEVKVLD